MSRKVVRRICRERLAGWTERLVEDNATPMILLGLTHGSAGGNLVLCTVEDMDIATLRTFLMRTLFDLQTIEKEVQQ